MTDKELYKKCRRYGSETLKWRWKFAGLLPEVERRKLYEKKGFSSIFHFAKKLCGMSEEQIRRALSMGKKFEKLPILREKFENGEVSPNKLSKVASVVNDENEEFWAGQVENLSTRAVETLVRDMKNENQDGLNKPKNEGFVHVNKFSNLELSDEVKERLIKLQEKGINVNELILDALQKREEEIELEKQEIGEECETTESRYVPVKTRRVLKEEFGDMCSIKDCNKKADHVHHLQRFAMSKNHDPRFMVPLCKEHHQISHAIDVKYNDMIIR